MAPSSGSGEWDQLAHGNHVSHSAEATLTTQTTRLFLPPWPYTRLKRQEAIDPAALNWSDNPCFVPPSALLKLLFVLALGDVENVFFSPLLSFHVPSGILPSRPVPPKPLDFQPRVEADACAHSAKTPCRSGDDVTEAQPKRESATNTPRYGGRRHGLGSQPQGTRARGHVVVSLSRRRRCFCLRHAPHAPRPCSLDPDLYHGIRTDCQDGQVFPPFHCFERQWPQRGMCFCTLPVLKHVSGLLD